MDVRHHTATTPTAKRAGRAARTFPPAGSVSASTHSKAVSLTPADIPFTSRTGIALAIGVIALLSHAALAIAAPPLRLSLELDTQSDGFRERLVEEIPAGALTSDRASADLRVHVYLDHDTLVVAITDAAGPVIERRIPTRDGVVPAQRVAVFLVRKTYEERAARLGLSPLARREAEGSARQPAGAQELSGEGYRDTSSTQPATVARPAPKAEPEASPRYRTHAAIGGQIWARPRAALPYVAVGASLLTAELRLGLEVTRSLPGCCALSAPAVDSTLTETGVAVRGSLLMAQTARAGLFALVSAGLTYASSKVTPTAYAAPAAPQTFRAWDPRLAAGALGEVSLWSDSVTLFLELLGEGRMRPLEVAVRKEYAAEALQLHSGYVSALGRLGLAARF